MRPQFVAREFPVNILASPKWVNRAPKAGNLGKGGAETVLLEDATLDAIVDFSDHRWRRKKIGWGILIHPVHVDPGNDDDDDDDDDGGGGDDDADDDDDDADDGSGDSGDDAGSDDDDDDDDDDIM